MSQRRKSLRLCGLPPVASPSVALDTHKEVKKEEELEKKEIVNKREPVKETSTETEIKKAITTEKENVKVANGDTIKKVTPANSEFKAMKGKCKSGRFWKSDRDRFRSVIKSKGLKSNLKAKMKLKEEKVRVKAMQKALADAKIKEKEDLRARQEENKKRREENEKKNQVLQLVTNQAKLKKMKKKSVRKT